MIQVDNSIVARPRASGQPVTSDAARKPTVAENLKTTNKAMLAQIKSDVMDFAHHPLQSLKTMAKGMAFPLTHPILMTKSLIEQIREDALAGSISAAGVATGLAFVGAVFLIGVGTLAAPLTGGASLALAASAAAMTTPIALACLAVDGAAIAMHQVRGALADSEAEAKEQGEEMAGWVEDAALNVASWVVGDAVQARFFPSGPDPAATLGRVLGDAANNTIGLAGIYDVPAPAAVPARPKPPAGTRSDRLDLSFKAREAFAN